MPDAVLVGTELSDTDSLGDLRDDVRSGQFKDHVKVRRFVDRYASAKPRDVAATTLSNMQSLVGDIRAELGLSGNATSGVDKAIANEVQALILGHTQATDDTNRWAVARGAQHVALSSGQFTYGVDDIHIDGGGIDFVFRRTYKNQGFATGPLGINWDHSHNQWLRVLDGGARIARGTGAFQNAVYVRHGQYGSANLSYWAPPAGEHSVVFDLKLRAAEFGITSTHGAQYGARLPDGQVYFFEKDPSGLADDTHRLSRVEDRYGNYLAFDYDAVSGLPGGRLSSVTINSPYRFVQLKHDLQGRIVSVRDHMTREWRYGYDAYGDLVSATIPGTDRYPAGLSETYSYSSASQSGALQHNLLRVDDASNRSRIENEYGATSGELSCNRITRQREGSAERRFLYENVSLATGLPSSTAAKERLPTAQTVVVQRNGHPVHYIYNCYGNLLAREEDAWVAGTRRRLVSQRRYNEDGALVGEVSTEGRITQRLFGREAFLAAHQVQGLTEAQLRQRTAYTWQARLSFGNTLAEIRRAKRQPLSAYHYPDPLPGLDQASLHTDDIITKYTYDPVFHLIASVSHPQYTNSPWPASVADSIVNNPDYHRTLTTFVYGAGGRELSSILYPDTTRDGHPDLKSIRERFLTYDGRGRLLRHEDRGGTVSRREYYPAAANAGDPDKGREGYLQKETVDPADPIGNPNGLNLMTRYDVNVVGSTTKLTTPKGTVVTFDLNSLQQVTSVTRFLSPGVGYETRYRYGRDLMAEEIERDLCNTWGKALWGGPELRVFEYDGNGNLNREEVGGTRKNERHVSRYLFDDGDQRVGTLLPRGNQVSVEYDARRYPRRVVRGPGTPEETAIAITHDGDGLRTMLRDGRGLKTHYDYDAFGRVVTVRDCDADGKPYRTVRTDYDKLGNVTVERVFDASGGGYAMLSHISHHYDELGQRVESRERRFDTPIPASATEVSAAGQSVLADQAHRRLWWYDKAGRVIKEEELGHRLTRSGKRAAAPTSLTTTHEYNAAGWPVTETDALGTVTETRYDDHGLVCRVDVREKVPTAISPTGEEVFTTTYAYDALDRLVAVTDALGNTHTFEFDSRDQIIMQTDPLGNVSRFEYDVYGRQVAQRIRMTSSGLGGAGQTSVDALTRFAYDANSNLTGFTDPNGRQIGQTFDALDRRTAAHYADGSSTTWIYDGNDNPVSARDPRGVICTTKYDPLDYLLRCDIDRSALAAGTKVDAPSYEAFEHDALGRLRRARNDWVDIGVAVDSLGHATAETSSFTGLSKTFTIERLIDDFGFVSRQRFSNGRVVYRAPDGLQRLTAIENVTAGAAYPGAAGLPGKRSILTRSHRGLRSGNAVLGNGADVAHRHDKAGRLTGIEHRLPGPATLLTLDYLHDGNGNPRLCVETQLGAQHIERYRYDSQSQLTKIEPLSVPPTLPSPPLSPAQTVPTATAHPRGQNDIDAVVGALAMKPGDATFTYDPAGNRLTETYPGQPVVISGVNLNNQCTQHAGTSFDFDAGGHLSQQTENAVVRTFTHNHRGQLVGVDDAGQIVRFRHDPLGRRIWSSAAGEEQFFVYADGRILEEWHRKTPQTTVTLRSQYLHDDDTDACCHIATGGHDYWVHTDLVGSTRAVTDQTGTLVASYTFTAFGQWRPTGALPAPYVPLLFGGKRYDALLNAYDFGAREYVPALGRFLERDPIALRPNDPVDTEPLVSARDAPLPGVRQAVDVSGGADREPESRQRLPASVYGYALNNPLRFVDPTGESPTEAAKTLANSKAFRILVEVLASIGAKKPTGYSGPKVPPPPIEGPVSGEDIKAPKPKPEPQRPKPKGRPPQPRPSGANGPRSQTARQLPQTRARGGPTRGTQGFATPDAIRGVGMGFVHGYVINGYITLFRAGLGLDLEQRQKWSDVFRMSKEQVEALRRQRRAQDLKQAQRDYDQHLQRQAKERGITVDQLKARYRRARERTRHEIRSYPTIGN